jgi:hypothetical protein
VLKEAGSVELVRGVEGGGVLKEAGSAESTSFAFNTKQITSNTNEFPLN